MRKDSPIRTLADLKGKKVAATKGTDPYLFLLRALKTAGLKRSDIEHVGLQHADGRAALEQGRVDAWAGLDRHMAASELEGGSRLIYRNVAFNTYGFLNVRDDLLATRPHETARVIKAYERARKWVGANQTEAARILAEEARVSLPVALLQIKLRSDFSNPQPSAEHVKALQLAAPILRDEALAKPGTDLDKVIADLVDTRFAQAFIARAYAMTTRSLDLPVPARGPALRMPLGLVAPGALLLAAEAGARSGLIPANLLPAPSEILRTLLYLAQNGLAAHVAASSVRVLAGFAAGASLAVVLGAAVALSRRTEALLDPTFQALRAIPSLAWVPLLLLWFGIDELPKLVLIAIGAVFPVYMGVVSGIRGVDRKLVEVARLYQLGRVALARRVLLPAALPALMTGLRNGLSLAWMFMVAAELIAASKGLGYLLSDGRETSRADIVLAAIVLLAVLGKASDSVMQLFEKHLLAWRDNHVERDAA